MHTLRVISRIGSRPIASKGGRRLPFESARFRFSGVAAEDPQVLECRLKKLKNLQAKLLAARIAQNKLNFRPSKPDAIAEALSGAKARHPNDVIFIHMGSCYEVHGTDAVLCIEHCDITPTGDACHLEIPKERLQAVVNALKSNDLGVVVYDFVTALESTSEDGALLLKKTLLFSHDASPTDGHITADRTPVGTQADSIAFCVTHNRSGYSISTIDPLKRKVEIRDRLTFAGALSLLQTAGGRVVIFQNGKPQVKKLLMHVPIMLHYEPLQGHSSAEGFHEAACRNIKMRLGITKGFRVSKITTLRGTREAVDRETAATLGLDDENSSLSRGFKGLDRQMLPENSQPYMRQYMRFMLSHTMPPDVSENVRYLAGKLATSPVPLLDTKPVSPAKIRAALSQYKVDPSYLREIDDTLKAFTYYTRSLTPSIAKRVHAVALDDHNINITLKRLQADAEKCSQIIGTALASGNVDVTPPLTGIKAIDDMFQRLETPLKAVHRPLFMRELHQVDHAAYMLLDSITKEYMTMTCSGNDRNDISSRLRLFLESVPKNAPELIVNRHFVLLKNIRDVPDHTKLHSTDTIHGSTQVRGYVSRAVTDALRNYRNCCALADAKANQVLSQIAKTISPYAQSMVLCAHFIVVLHTLASHVGMAVPRGWTLPTMSNGKELVFKNLVPQFDDQDDTVPISINVEGIHVLQGSNNTGRSTLLTTVLGACVAARAGLYVPCSNGSRLPKYTGIIYHSPSKQPEANGMSSFKYNIKTAEDIINNADSSTLVVMDDLGSNLDVAHGTAFVSAVIQKLALKGCNALIATNVGTLEMNDAEGVYFNTLSLKGGTLRFTNTPHQDSPFRLLLQNSALMSAVLRDAARYKTGGPDAETRKLMICNPVSKARALGNNLEGLPSSARDAMTLVLDEIEELGLCSKTTDLVHILPDAIPPPMLNNVPVVYVLVIPLHTGEPDKGCSAVECSDVCMADGEITAAVYVGESANLDARLKAHRSKPISTVDEYMGKTYMEHESNLTAYLKSKLQATPESSEQLLQWHSAHTLAIRAISRKDAKVNERKLIKRLYMRQNQIVLLSQRDGVYRELVAID
ncbi:putative DNA mismatch repair protein [Babesia sp. Xinjiang]|uniref:putative DNA mismatch repair protein n=1 Tax=Babesia sp. Xinjiang TaxID=462227 RepID=UPI000A241999|nr:putative DNA mismatch repair protein [Babesia sp. Xinjiang]ORM39446.1 putative DNA mismatch repair protein [Babesia sp. Xinjiang]